MARTLFMRRLASVSCAVAVVATGGSLGGGYYIYGQENAALLDVRPEMMIVSLQQSSDLTVEKQMPGGDSVLLDNSRIRWSFSRDNIARVDGNRVSGLNLGETELSGQYRNKLITMNVRVVEPMDGMVDISQRYQQGRTAVIFAGTDERDYIDGTLADSEFVSPESIAVAGDGTVYLTDAGLLRKIDGNRVESIYIEPFYITPHIVRCYKNEVYILSDAWESDDGYSYGIARLSGSAAEMLYVADATYTAVEDFVCSSEGLIWIERNPGIGGVFLRTLNPDNPDEIDTLCELPEGTAAITIGERGVVYLANPETGAIQVYRDGRLSYFAGVENEKAFIDGSAPLFYMPQRLEYSDGYLYVWDFNVLRRITVTDGVAAECITIAGEASPEFDLELPRRAQAAEDIVLPNSMLADFAVLEDEVMVTDPKRGVIWWVE